MSKFVGTGPSSYKKRIYRAAVSQKLRNTALDIDTYLNSRKGHTQTKVYYLVFFFNFTNGCTIYLRRSASKFTLKFTFKLLLHVSVIKTVG